VRNFTARSSPLREEGIKPGIMSLKDIFCQDNAVELLLRGYLSEHTAHAYIFAGADGVGKFKTAYEFGKLLLCEKPLPEKNFADSCGKCESCRCFEAGTHPDFVHVYKELLEFTEDGKGREAPVEMPIDVIREFLVGQVSKKPTLSARRVFVVSEAEKLNISSQNALLKVLEEPPVYCCIILLCTRLERLLATTKSRCQIIRFGPIDQQRIFAELSQMGLGKKEARFFSRLAQGSIGQASSWAQLESAGASLYQRKIELIESLAEYKYEDSLELAQRFVQASKELGEAWAKADAATSKSDIGRRACQTIIRIVISALNDAMKLNLGDESNMTNTDQKEQIAALARKFSPEEAAERIADCFETLRWVESSVNEKLLFEQLLLKLAGCDKMKVQQ
jgi:DNA polymerase-3 subunit delta'